VIVPQVEGPFIEYGTVPRIETSEGVFTAEMTYREVFIIDGKQVYTDELPRGAPQTKPKRRRKQRR
jgi:hypothetical protein